MARIAGVVIPENKAAEVALTYVYGIGRSSAKKILQKCQISSDTKIKDLNEEDLTKIRDYISANHQVEGDLQQATRLNINRLKDINAYRGVRHKSNLPARGQRTRTNARTKRGRRVTVGSGRKKAPTPK